MKPYFLPGYCCHSFQTLLLSSFGYYKYYKVLEEQFTGLLHITLPGGPEIFLSALPYLSRKAPVLGCRRFALTLLFLRWLCISSVSYTHLDVYKRQT